MPSDDDPARSGPDLSRRRLLGGLAATGATSAVAADLDAAGAASAAPSLGDGATTDPHTDATFRAFVDAVIPQTPELAERRGDEHEFGARAVGLEEFVVWFLNRTLEPGLYRLLEESATVRLAEGVATTLDVGAATLLARGGNGEPPDPTRFPGGGPFASLAESDRFRAIEEVESLPPGRLPEPFDELSDQVGYVVQALHLLATAGYYTEWAGYGETRTSPPSERRYAGGVPSREQTGYPGPIDGAADHRGYEVERFRENDYPTKGDGGRSEDDEP